MLLAAIDEGFELVNATAKVCQDIILKGIADSSLSRNVTVKGGVVMRGLSNNVRRATQDLDIDFIRYSLDDDSIERFIRKINCVPGIKIETYGRIEELKQQEYKGKRVFVRIIDDSGELLESKIDFGVHKNLDVNQEEFCFDIANFDEGACLLINSKEQMFTEKLRSIVKFGSYSTRYKDIFDMCYLLDGLDEDGLSKCIATYIIDDEEMLETSMSEIYQRISKTFGNHRYMSRLAKSGKNWLDIPEEAATERILVFLRGMLK